MREAKSQAPAGADTAKATNHANLEPVPEHAMAKLVELRLPAWSLQRGSTPVWWKGEGQAYVSGFAMAGLGEIPRQSRDDAAQDGYHICLNCDLAECNQKSQACGLNRVASAARPYFSGVRAMIKPRPKIGYDRRWEGYHGGQPAWALAKTSCGSYIVAETGDGRRIGYVPEQIELLEPLLAQAANQSMGRRLVGTRIIEHMRKVGVCTKNRLINSVAGSRKYREDAKEALDDLIKSGRVAVKVVYNNGRMPVAYYTLCQ